jgi:penicillin-binding protein 1C
MCALSEEKTMTKSLLQNLKTYKWIHLYITVWNRIQNILKNIVHRYTSLSPRWKGWSKVVFAIVSVYLLLKITAWVIPLPNDALFRPSSTLIFDRSGKLLNAYLSEDDTWRIRTSLGQISPYLQQSLLGFEDRWFYFHPGVNPLALARALRQNIKLSHIVSGGSTVTMQIARMMEPKQRNYGNKFYEILRAFQLELRYSKRQLLEIYFNIAPYGGNIEGVAAASWLYFGKEPSELSLSEAALLTAIPNSPNIYRPNLDFKKSLRARNRVLERLVKQGTISRSAFQEAVHEEIPECWQQLPHKAPHFCCELHLDFPDKPRLYSTLNYRYQAVAEDLLRIHLRSLKNEGISNGAIVIIDNTRHEILAMVGSGDFNDYFNQGQVNGALAPRSPGSALKPFIYAMAIQKGFITPAHYVEDVPTDFSGYAPENYDRTFSGILSAREALERSLNLPAVELEHQLGQEGLYSLLKQVGVSTLRSRKNYGLSIAIGGCEVNLLDLTTLYSSLASDGQYFKPRQFIGDPESTGIRLFDPGTAFIITDILTGLRRPDLPTCWEFTSLPQVAWKTGTSYGHRDALSIGYNPQFTVGVWLGNFSGEGARNLVGAEVAAPILFEIMNYLNRGKQIQWFEKPENVGTREVCSLSGELPGPNCPQVVNELYLVNRVSDKICSMHQAVQVDNRSGYRLPPDYAGKGPTHIQSFIQWPPRVFSWMENNGAKIDRLPPLLPDWQGLLPGSPPIIRSPSMDCQYRLREGIPLEYQKICCEASVSNDVQKVFWFIDGSLLGIARPGERMFYNPKVGRHRVVCQDDLGRSTSFTLMIEKAD